MLGRIIKNKGRFYCTARGKTLTVEVDNADKLTNGDLVQIKDKLFNKSSTIKRSEIKVLKQIPPKAKFITVNESTPLIKRLKNRVLDLRRQTNQSRFIVRSEINRILQNLFHTSGYTSVNTPLIVGSVLEGRVKTFDIDFFGKEASLTMTKLVHLRYLICSDFGKVFDLSPVFVGGQHKTTSHVAEYYTFDWASSEIIDFNKHLRFVDEIISKMLLMLSKSVFDIEVDLDTDTLFKQAKKMKVVPYYELMNRYAKANPKNEEALEQFHLPGKVIDFAHKTYSQYIWITEFPESFKQFYCDTKKSGDKTVVQASELWWNGIKVASVSFSNSDYEKSLDRIKFLGLNPKNFETYLNSIQLGSSEAYLGSLYIERLMMVLLKIENMKETLMFPRAAQGTVLDP